MEGEARGASGRGKVSLFGESRPGTCRGVGSSIKTGEGRRHRTTGEKNLGEVFVATYAHVKRNEATHGEECVGQLGALTTKSCRSLEDWQGLAFMLCITSKLRTLAHHWDTRRGQTSAAPPGLCKRTK